MTAYLIPGLVIGIAYSLAALGLVVTYRTTGVLNLANGAIAFVAGEFFYNLVDAHALNPLVAGAVTLFLFAPLLGLVLWATVFRKLESAPFAVTLVSTIGLAIALPALMRIIYRHGPVIAAPGLLKNGREIHEIWGLTVSGDQLVAIVGGTIVIAIVIVVLNVTPIGLTMRAVVDSHDVAVLMGTRTELVSASAWMLGAFLAGTAGILLTPIVQLDPVVFTELTVASLSVALFGQLRRMGQAWLGGMLLGITSALLIRYSPSGGLISSGIRPSLPFLLLVVLLLFRGRSLDAVEGERPQSLLTTPSRWLGVTRFHLERPALVIILLLVPLVVSAYWAGVLVAGFAFAIVFLSFSLAVGEGGLVPLCQASFAGLGGFVGGQIAESHGLSPLAAIAIGGIVAMAAGFAIAVIGMRFGRLGFALLTLAFALFADRFLFRIESLVPRNGIDFADFKLFGIDFASERPMLYLYMAIFALAAFGVWKLRKSGLGLYFAAARGNRVVAESTGVSTKSLRVTAFTLAAGLAGVGGVMLGLYQRHLGPEDVTTLTALVWIAVAITMGSFGVFAPLLAGLSYALLPALLLGLPTRFAELPVVLFGLGAVSLAQDPRGVVASTRDSLAQLKDKLVRGRSSVPSPTPGHAGDAAGLTDVPGRV